LILRATMGLTAEFMGDNSSLDLSFVVMPLPCAAAAPFRQIIFARKCLDRVQPPVVGMKEIEINTMRPALFSMTPASVPFVCDFVVQRYLVIENSRPRYEPSNKKRPPFLDSRTVAGFVSIGQ